MKIFKWDFLTTGSTWYGLGRHLRLLSGVGYFDVEIQYAQDRIRTRLIPGIGANLSHPVTGEQFQALHFSADTPQNADVLVAEFPVDDNRIQGQVTIDTVLQQEFALYTANSWSANTAGNYNHIFLDNPLGSGVDLFLHSIDIAPDATSTNAIQIARTDYTSSVMTLQSTGNPVTHKTYELNECMALVKSGYTGGGLLDVNNTRSMGSATSADKKFSLKTPLVIPPGKSFVVTSLLTQTSFNAAMNWEERPTT